MDSHVLLPLETSEKFIFHNSHPRLIPWTCQSEWVRAWVASRLRFSNLRPVSTAKVSITWGWKQTRFLATSRGSECYFQTLLKLSVFNVTFERLSFFPLLFFIWKACSFGLFKIIIGLLSPIYAGYQAFLLVFDGRAISYSCWCRQLVNSLDITCVKWYGQQNWPK